MTKTKKGYELYPLTVAQKFHLYYLPYCPSAAVLNIGTSLTIGTEVDWEVLRGSINKAYERSEAMRIRFTKDADGTYYQYIVDDTEDRKSRKIDFGNDRDGSVTRRWPECRPDARWCILRRPP